MMKKFLSLALLTALLLSLAPASLAQTPLPADRLVNLEHNAPNTGKMLPQRFDPYQNTYLLTVANWVSRITFTPPPRPPMLL
mgnify:FL=1